MLLKVGYLDYILVEGDKLYKLLGFQGYLNVEELPPPVKIFERTVNLEILEENLHDSDADADSKVPRFVLKVSVFKELINSGPYYICVACNRNLYKKSVVLFPRDKYSIISDDVFRHVTPLDGKSYICKTCGKK